MSDDSSLRAGDADRDRVVSVLTQAFAEGRLTEDEFDQRRDAAHRAVTFGDLAPLTADLPGGAGAGASVPAQPVPAAPVPGAPPGGVAGPPVTATSAGYPPASYRVPDDHRRKGLAAGWASWAGVGVMMIAIWLASVVSRGPDEPMPGFWPIWVIGPWGVAMVVASIRSGDD